MVTLKFHPSPPTGELAFLACRAAASPPIPTRGDPCGVTHTSKQRRCALFHCLVPFSLIYLFFFYISMQTISCLFLHPVFIVFHCVFILDAADGWEEKKTVMFTYVMVNNKKLKTTLSSVC